jgi:glycosyltransferase involved in cell wall biosynthesis
MAASLALSLLSSVGPGGDMERADLICFSHLRWNFVYQRPNHLMQRCAAERRVFFVEEPVHVAGGPFLELQHLEPQLFRVVPHFAPADPSQDADTLARLLVELCRNWKVDQAIHWYYSPMFLPATARLRSILTVYDCMDELSAFKGAPLALSVLERKLLARADLVFTGGMALHEAKRSLHPHVVGVPSSVDVPFFARARSVRSDPEDQASIPHPRVGYYGVIDERIDLPLIHDLAAQRSDLHFVMVGPLAKIDETSLPRAPNIHYLGLKPYAELPAYAAGWDVAFMPFALNDATRFISPTKTPEYLAAGKPVVSSAVRDVVEPYERLGLVRIARSAAEFLTHIDALKEGQSEAEKVRRDAFLADNSWDSTWSRMRDAMTEAYARRSRRRSAITRAAE